MCAVSVCLRPARNQAEVLAAKAAQSRALPRTQAERPRRAFVRRTFLTEDPRRLLYCRRSSEEKNRALPIPVH